MCEYCENEKPIIDWENGYDSVFVVIDDGCIDVSGCAGMSNVGRIASINFCPMCGTKLRSDDEN